MFPTVNQSIESVCKTLQELIIPELEGKGFVQEQAAMILAQLTQAVDVNNAQQSYLLVELRDSITLLECWEKSQGFGSRELKTYQKFVRQPALISGFRSQSDLEDDLISLKQEIESELNNSPPENGSKLHRTLHKYIARQLERENAWFRLSGFLGKSSELECVAKVLKNQITTPL